MIPRFRPMPLFMPELHPKRIDSGVFKQRPTQPITISNAFLRKILGMSGGAGKRPPETYFTDFEDQTWGGWTPSVTGSNPLLEISSAQKYEGSYSARGFATSSTAFDLVKDFDCLGAASVYISFWGRNNSAGWRNMRIRIESVQYATVAMTVNVWTNLNYTYTGAMAADLTITLRCDSNAGADRYLDAITITITF